MKPENQPTTAAGWTENLKALRRPRDRAECLLRCARRMGLEVKDVAEVGVFEAKLSLQLRQNWPNAHLWLIDPWRHIPDLTKMIGRMHRVGQSAEGNQKYWDDLYRKVCSYFAADRNASILRMFSKEAAAVVPDNSLDIVHIDGDHRYEPVCEDIKLWLPKVKPGGMVTGHDYSQGRTRWQGSRAYLYKAFEAVNDTLGQENIVPCQQMLWIYIKRRPDERL